MMHRRWVALSTLIAAAMATTPAAGTEPVAPAAQPVREEVDDIYAELDEVEEAEAEALPEPLPEFTVTSIMDEATLAQQIALGVGIGGLAVSTITVAGSMDEPRPGAIVLSGVTLGLSVLGFATAGVIELFDDDEPLNIAIGAGSIAADISF